MMNALEIALRANNLQAFKAHIEQNPHVLPHVVFLKLDNNGLLKKSFLEYACEHEYIHFIDFFFTLPNMKASLGTSSLLLQLNYKKSLIVMERLLAGFDAVDYDYPNALTILHLVVTDQNIPVLKLLLNSITIQSRLLEGNAQLLKLIYELTNNSPLLLNHFNYYGLPLKFLSLNSDRFEFQEFNENPDHHYQQHRDIVIDNLSITNYLPVFQAIKRDRANVACALLRLYPCTNASTFTQLFFKAIDFGQSEVVEHLMTSDFFKMANINRVDVLIHASKANKSKITNYLLETSPIKAFFQDNKNGQLRALFAAKDSPLQYFIFRYFRLYGFKLKTIFQSLEEARDDIVTFFDNPLAYLREKKLLESKEWGIHLTSQDLTFALKQSYEDLALAMLDNEEPENPKDLHVDYKAERLITAEQLKVAQELKLQKFVEWVQLHIGNILEKNADNLELLIELMPYVSNDDQIVLEFLFKAAIKHGCNEIIERLMTFNHIRNYLQNDTDGILVRIINADRSEVLTYLMRYSEFRKNLHQNNNTGLLTALRCQNESIIKILLENPLVVETLLLHQGRQLRQIQMDINTISDHSFDLLLNHLQIYHIPATIISDGTLESLEGFFKNPSDFLKGKGYPLSKIQAIHIVAAYQQVRDYEALQKEKALAQLDGEDIDNGVRVAGAKNYFESVIQPVFQPSFERYGDTDIIRITAIEKEIRLQILQSIEHEAKQANHILQAKKMIRFIRKNRNALATGNRERLMNTARHLFNSKVILSHIAWRAYDPLAPVYDNPENQMLTWPSLLTAPQQNSNTQIWTIRELNLKPEETSLDAASWLARKLMAYNFLLSIDPNDESPIADRIANFIAQLADIRRAHNEDEDTDSLDSPSCLPGIYSRAPEIWRLHALAMPMPLDILIQAFVKIWIVQQFKKAIADKSLLEQEAIYNSLIYLGEHNAGDILRDKTNTTFYDEKLANVRQNFMDEYLGSLEECLKFVNDNLQEIKVRTLLAEEQCYIEKYRVDLGGLWIANALTQLRPKMPAQGLEAAEPALSIHNPYLAVLNMIETQLANPNALKAVFECKKQLYQAKHDCWQALYTQQEIKSQLNIKDGKYADLCKTMIDACATLDVDSVENDPPQDIQTVLRHILPDASDKTYESIQQTLSAFNIVKAISKPFLPSGSLSPKRIVAQSTPTPEVPRVVGPRI